jgi:hypothetical protein
MHHIQYGLDHLLFIILLILISPLLTENKKWTSFGGWRYTLFRIFKIVTAFTFGHTITLCVFSFFSLNGFSKFIEIGIALTIIFTAIHSIRPIIQNKEIYITFFFGLIHGSAFGITLNGWELSKSQKVLSLLGFNIGIEIMQLIIVLFALPLIYFSKNQQYKTARLLIASLTIFVSTFWLIERVQGKPNFVTDLLNTLI